MLAAAVAISILSARGEAPAGYYSSLEGKSGAALKLAAKAVAAKGLATVKYSEATWPAFERTDVREFNGSVIWWDMYSNFPVVVASGHDGMNIEHSVANSWWGGKSGSIDAYQDLYHLNPSNSVANNSKSDNPLGEVTGTPTFDNGLVLVGSPAGGLGGGSAKVFEPADEYKGDFARAYFYIFTTYDNIPWQSGGAMFDGSSYPTLLPWAYEMLLRWNEEDPVDSKELARHEEVAAIQGNRNPFIDMPQLADYIWGDKRSVAYDSNAAASRKTAERPSAPVFTGYEPYMVNTYTGRWWTATDIDIEYDPDSRLMVSVNGSAYQPLTRAGVSIDGASGASDKATVKAYAVRTADGKELGSPVAVLNLTAKDPSMVDFTEGKWKLVKSGSELTAADRYIIVSVKNGAVMSSNFGSNGFMQASEQKVDASSDMLERVHTDAGVVALHPESNGYTLQILDTKGVSKGYYTTTAAKKMSLKSTGTPASITISDGGDATVSFGSPGILLYNSSSPRFLNYTSNQEGIRLYRYSDETQTAVEDIMIESPVRVEGNSIVMPEGYRVFDLEGREMEARSLSPGIYIVVDRNMCNPVKVAVR